MENPKDNKKDNSTKGKKDKMDERVKNLFAEQDPPSYASIREVDAMKARIAELESKLAEQETALTQKSDAVEEAVTTAGEVSEPLAVQSIDLETGTSELEDLPAPVEEPTTGRFKLPSTLSRLRESFAQFVSKTGLSMMSSNLVVALLITAVVLIAAWSITSGGAASLFSVVNLETLSTQAILLLSLAVVIVVLLGYFLIRQFRTYPLRARLTASFLILTIVPLAIVGQQTYSSTYEILEGQIQAEILRSSINTSSEFQDFLDSQFNTMRVQARSSEFVSYLQLSEAQRTGSTEETLALEKLKSFAKNKSAYIMSYALVDMNGTAVLDTNKNRIGASYVGQEFFDYVMTNKTVYASGLVMLPSGDRVIYLAAPISNSGELVGMYVAALQPKYIQETIELLIRNDRGAAPQPDTEHTYVVDGSNYFVLAHSIRKDLLYKTYLSPDDPKLTKLVEQGADQERLNKLVDYQPEILAGLSGMEDTSIFEAPSYDGSLTQSAALRLPDSNWIVVTARNVDTISGAIQSQTRTNVTTSILIIAFVALFALVASRFFTRPIVQLTNVAERISAGDLTQKAVIHSHDEIGVLARTFNEMTDQVQTLVSGLEKRVQDRTHDLELATDVGRAVAERTGDLGELLTEAVELIRSRYELYYTQVYLLDAAGRYLVLRAGTGETGKVLLQRGHRLAVSANSLNSRAVTSQQPVLVGDTHSNENFLPNQLLPYTRSELAIPLLSSGRVVGVLDMQSDKPDTFNESNISAFEILSGQLAVAIQNSILFDQMNEARIQVEEQSRRLTSSGWQDFLNAVERSEAIGYEFNQVEVQPLADAQQMPDGHTLTIPIKVAGANIGEVQIADDATRIWSATETEIIETVVSRVAQHIETLRLLAQAERYRHQAEDVSRRLTTEGWNEYFRTRGEIADGFRYDREKVQPLNGNGDQVSEATLTHPLVIHNQPVGMMMVDTPNSVDDDTNELVAAIVERLSEHIENLRLLEETQEQRIQLSGALTIAKLGHWEYDLERDVFTFNDQFYSLFHTTAKQVGGYELSSADYARLFVHPDDAPLVGKEIERALASTDRHFTAKTEHRVIFPEGGIGYVAVDINLERDENGKITRWYGANQDITERKLAELTVRASEARLAEALEIAKLANWEYDFERDRFLFNDQFYSLFHTTAEQVGGYELSSADYARLFVHPEDAPLVGKEIEKALASTDRHFTAKVEHRITFPEGGIGYIAVDINLERDEDGKITRWYGANQDITDRKLAELAVVESEKRLQSILTSLPISILISRISDGQLMYYNEAFTKLFGYQESDLVGKATPDLYYEAQDRNTLFTELSKRGSLTGYELRNKHSDGHLIWTLLNVFPIRYGEDDCLLVGAVDVTQRKKIEETMSKRADQLETVAVLSTTTSTVLEPDALLQEVVNLTKERFGLYHAHIYLTDDDAATLSLSAGAGKIGEEMVEKGHSIFINVEKSLVARAFRERRAILVNDTASQPDFLPNPLLPNTRSEMAVPMIVGDTVLGVFDVQSDIADGFTREDANIYTTLASQVAVALQNARLYVEQAATLTQLRELDRLKSAFLANMSHELRTPLNSILGFTDVMLEGLDGDLTEYMDNDLRLIQKNGRHLLHLINDVLDMAKIESGRMNLHPESFRIHELLEEVFSITAPLASEKNLSLHIADESDREIEVYADNTRIRQVMINLVNNSIKFTEQGKITLSVKHVDGARALIAVKDTGIGIPKDHLESVFLEFTQVDTTTTRKVGGTGLGLPISRRLIEMHGGRLWADSTGISGEGSTFFVELPLEAQVSDVIEKQEAEV